MFEDNWHEIARIPIGTANAWIGTPDTYIKNDDGTGLVYWNESDMTMIVTNGTMGYLWLTAKDQLPPG